MLRQMVFAALAALVFAAPAWADPMQLGAQGRLIAAGGGPASDGNYSMAFALYEAPSGGAPVWQEFFLALPVQAGYFAGTLGGGTQKLDSALFAAGKPLWMGVTVGADPELPRQPVLRVPFAVHTLVAASAADLKCSGCVAAEDIAKDAITGDKIALGAVGANHVSFAWAAAESAGGAATFAVAANKAKAADFAEEANSAKTAAQADSAKGLQCTGCVKLDMIDPAALQPYAKTSDLNAYAKVADLTAYAKLSGDNAFTGKNAVNGLAFNKTEATLLRIHNAAKEPVACDASAVGLIYYNTVESALYVCNGKSFVMFATGVALGADANPAPSCKAIKDAGASVGNGIYWLDGDGKTGPAPKFAAWCDMTTDGGGWTEVLRCLPSDGCQASGSFLYVVNWQNADKGTASTTASYLSGLSTKPVFTGAKEFLVSIDDTATSKTGHMKFSLDNATQGFFTAGSLFESAPVNWTKIDQDGSTATIATRICFQPSGTNYPVRSFQGKQGLAFMGVTQTQPSNGSANSECDYGPWDAQILVRGNTGGVSANFGSASASNWKAQNYAHRVLVR